MTGSAMVRLAGRDLCRWFLLPLLTVGLAEADVYVRTRNKTEVVSRFPDFMASFGPAVPSEGVTGYVYSVHPPNACRDVQPPPDNASLWIALIARDNCSFVDKVRKVQAAGFSSAIVFNSYQDDNRVHMGGDGDDVNIPSVFVGWTDGQQLAEFYCFSCISANDGKYVVTIDDKEPYRPDPYLLWPFAVVVGTCFVLMIIFMLVKWCRDIRKKRKSRLSTKHLKKIPTKKFKKGNGEEYDVCAICLDDYEDGDKLRLLPCSHVYHCKCIDLWLTKNKRCCPICKRRVIPGDDPSSDSDSDGGESSSERTPLLAGSGNGNNNRRSTFDNSGLPETARPSRQGVEERASNSIETASVDSDSELGAVGGSQVSANQSFVQTAVIETEQGADNSGYHSDDDDVIVLSDEDSEEDFHDDSFMFTNGNGKKEEAKQLNHVV